MSFIKITSISFAAPPNAATYIFFKYRKVGDPLWINISGLTSILIPITGILPIPLLISNLQFNTEYEIAAEIKNCPGSQHIITATTPSEACPGITDIGITTTN